MLSPDAKERIEDKALDKFVENGRTSKISDVQIFGEIPEWSDADRYNMVDAECTIPGEIIKEWLYDDFNTIIEKYLKVTNYNSISEMSHEQMFYSPIEYFEYCMDLYQEIEDYFWDQIYPELQQSYFEDHAEKI